MQVELRIVGSTEPGSTIFTIGAIQLPRGKFLIGRDPECQFRPNSPLVSRHHCVIVHDEYAVRIRDLGSKNGTIVNSERIHGDHVLASEDAITVGDVTLQILIEDVDADQTINSDSTVTENSAQSQAARTQGTPQRPASRLPH